MKYDLATPIELKCRKDPQGFVIVEHVRDEAWLYIRCIDAQGDDTHDVGCLHFEGVWHIASSRFRTLRSYPAVMDSELLSYYLEVEQSSLLDSLIKERSVRQPDWQQYDRRRYRHWIVESHDYYTDIIAAKVSYLTLQGAAAQRCHDIWAKV